MTTEHNRRTTDLLAAEILQLRFALSKFTWHPIETAPKDESWIIITDGEVIVNAYFNDVWQDHLMMTYSPTHWMPMLTQPIATPKGE